MVKKINKNNEGQIKIQQMAFMLIGIILFFALISIFFITIKFSSINKDVERLNQEKAMSIAISITKTPEFKCSGIEGEGACIDLDRALVIKDKKIFKNLWPVNSIELRKTYPEVESGEEKEIECTINNYPECNLIKIIENNYGSYETAESSSYVKLCRKEKGVGGYVYNKCELGRIIIKI